MSTPDYSGTNPSVAANTPPEASPEHVLEIALDVFATEGYTNTKLEQIAKLSGMSKRMIHYHFGDKRGLYHQCLVRAIELLRPSALDMEIDSAVPVEGVRKVVEAVYRCYVENPNASRLIGRENMTLECLGEGSKPLLDQSATMLQLDKLLMLGQDAGAFRPGISAQDVFTLIASISVFRVNSRPSTLNLYGVDMMDEQNTAGIARLVVDTVLAFLTSNLKSEPSTSYISMSEQQVSSAADGGDSSYDVSANPFE